MMMITIKTLNNNNAAIEKINTPLSTAPKTAKQSLDRPRKALDAKTFGSREEGGRWLQRSERNRNERRANTRTGVSAPMVPSTMPRIASHFARTSGSPLLLSQRGNSARGYRRRLRALFTSLTSLSVSLSLPTTPPLLPIHNATLGDGQTATTTNNKRSHGNETNTMRIQLLVELTADRLLVPLGSSSRNLPHIKKRCGR